VPFRAAVMLVFVLLLKLNVTEGSPRSAMLNLEKKREPLLWWIAGADGRILRECPRADQIFVQHLGISLVGAFGFVFLISSISMVVAFPDLAGAKTGIAVGVAFLIATTTFLLDRLFIQADWDWQARKQRVELAKAAWEESPANTKIDFLLSESSVLTRFYRTLSRFLVISFRVVLSAAIGLSIASFLELVIYKNEISSLIHKLHYEDNRSIYDEIATTKDALGQEVISAKGERDRLLAAKAKVEGEFNALISTPPSIPSDTGASEVDRQIAELRTKLSVEQSKAQRFAEDMIAERNGAHLNDGNSGITGEGKKFKTAKELKDLSDAAIQSLQTRLAELEKEKDQIISRQATEYQAAKNEIAKRARAMHDRLANIESELVASQKTFDTLAQSKDASINEKQANLEKSPSFVPISFGVANQFRALRRLYSDYGSTFEKWMVKLLIMLLEMTPVIQKVLFSPNTLYGVKLDAAKRAGAYSDFDQEVRLRQNLLKRKADAAVDEQLDSKHIERLRTSNVRSM
jgi:hypothetical protein